MVRKILLVCGIASSVLYVASDILISWWDPNYSYRDQSFSELLAPGSPTRPRLDERAYQCPKISNFA